MEGQAEAGAGAARAPQPTRVLLLKAPPLPDSPDPYAQEFAKAGLGLAVHYQPVLETCFGVLPPAAPAARADGCGARPSREPLESLLLAPCRYSGLIFTSGNAAKALSIAVGNVEAASAGAWSSQALPLWRSKHVFALGHATADKVSAALGTECSGRGGKNATALGQHILATMRQAPAPAQGATPAVAVATGAAATTPPTAGAPLPLLYLAGDNSRPELPALLAGGTGPAVPFEKHVVYSTNPVPDVGLRVRAFVERHPGTCVAFFSPSGVDAALAPLLRRPAAAAGSGSGGGGRLSFSTAAIGKTTASAFDKYAERVGAVAAQPSPQGLAEAVRAHLL